MKRFWLLCALALALSAGGCAAEKTAPEPLPEPPYAEGQLYAVAYLGAAPATDAYAAYLGAASVPVLHLSGEEYYLVIPRYDDMAVSVSRADMERAPELLYEETICRPFVVCCNVSDIFPDALIRLTRGQETVEFSPSVSLRDGSVLAGDRGLNITK